MSRVVTGRADLSRPHPRLTLASPSGWWHTSARGGPCWDATSPIGSSPNDPGTHVWGGSLIEASSCARAALRTTNSGWRVSEFQVNENSDIYYQGRYWNDLDCVVQMFNNRISGCPEGSWYSHFARTTDKTFTRALILNCGNGWVERDLIRAGLVKEAVGIDYSSALLEQASAAADEANLPIRYHQMDTNSASFPDDEFDLVVNYAAAHHISMIDRVFRELCTLLPEDGWFVSFDYVGPHRNQYRADAWEAAWQVNAELPEHVRQEMSYPNLPTMLHDDPTEAIHSELIVETLLRYFEVEQFTPLGGAVAYPLLTHNQRLFAIDDLAERTRWAEMILAADDAFLRDHPDSSLFAYVAARPNKAALSSSAQLARWTNEEIERERTAEQNGGEYYPRLAYPTAEAAAEEARRELAVAQARIADLQRELDAFNHSPAHRLVRRALGSSMVRRARAWAPVAELEQKARGLW